MKTLIICIMAAVISTSYGSFLSALLGGEGQNQRPAPQKFLHHHHHQHEVLHKSIVADHHPWDNSNAIHGPVGVHPSEHVQIYKIVYENGGHGHHQLGHHDIGHDHGNGPVYHHAPPHVITKVVQPVLNKNFIHNTHEHHYHQHHDASSHGYHHQGNGWD